MRPVTIWIAWIPDSVFLQIGNNCCWDQQSAFFRMLLFFARANSWPKIPKILNSLKMKFTRSSLEISGESTIFGQNYRSTRNFGWGTQKFHFGKNFGSESSWDEKNTNGKILIAGPSNKCYRFREKRTLSGINWIPKVRILILPLHPRKHKISSHVTKTPVLQISKLPINAF